MMIIVGLGNPGEKFENTRHNAGFLAVDFFAKKNYFPDFEFSKKHDSLISEKNKVLLAKPETFMNKSGLAIKKITSDAGWKKANLVVIHDDIDLPTGKIKIVKNRGSAGHKGVESVIKAIGNKNLIRIRMGVQPLKGKPKNTEKIVVQKFNEEEIKKIKTVLKKISEALDYFIKNGLEKTMNEYNK